MIDFLYGQDHYRLKNYAKEKHQDKSLDWQSFNCSDEADVRSLIELISYKSLFPSQIHAYAFNIFDAHEMLEAKIDKIIGADFPIILAHSLPKEKLNKINKDFFKKLTADKAIEAQEFNYLEKTNLIKFAKDSANLFNCDFEPRALQILLLGAQSQDTITRKNFTDTHVLKNYIAQCALYAKGSGRNKITDKDVLFFVPEPPTGIFECIDAIVSRDTIYATNILKKYLNENDGGEGLFYLLSSQIKNLFIIRSMLDRKISSQDINTKLKIHPYVFQKSVQAVQRYTESELKQMYLKLINADLDIRVGRTDHEKAIWSLIFV